MFDQDLSTILIDLTDRRVNRQKAAKLIKQFLATRLHEYAVDTLPRQDHPPFRDPDSYESYNAIAEVVRWLRGK